MSLHKPLTIHLQLLIIKLDPIHPSRVTESIRSLFLTPHSLASCYATYRETPSMGSSNTLPPTASGIPPIGQLRGMLGYGDETNGRVDFQRNCASFIDDHFYQENINRDNFCNWKDNAHKTLFTNLASQYLRINGRRFWPDRDTVDSDPAQLRWPQENAT